MDKKKDLLLGFARPTKKTPLEKEKQPRIIVGMHLDF